MTTEIHSAHCSVQCCRDCRLRRPLGVPLYDLRRRSCPPETHNCLECQGVFLRKVGGPSVLTQLGHLFDETPAQLRGACERAVAVNGRPQADAAGAAPAGTQAPAAASSPADAEGGAAPGQAPPTRSAAGAAGGASAPEAASNGKHSTAVAEPVVEPVAAAAPGSRPVSELNVVREGSIELDYGSDDGESFHSIRSIQCTISGNLGPYSSHPHFDARHS